MRHRSDANVAGLANPPHSATEASRALAVVAAEPDSSFIRMFNASPVGLVLSRPSDGWILEINEAYCRLVGYAREELIGRRAVDDLHLWADVGQRAALMDAIRRCGSVRDFEAVYRIGDGALRTVLLSGQPFVFRGIGCILSSALDITETKRAQAARARSEATYRALFDNMPRAVAHCRIVLDGDAPVDSVYLQVNPAWTAMTGCHDVVGRCASDILPQDPVSQRDALVVYDRVARTGAPARWDQYVADPPTWYSHSAYSPASGEFVVVSENVTERRRNDAELRRHRLHLEALVEQRTAELEVAKDAAEAAARAKSAFIANMSHEVRTPLNAVLGVAQLGLRQATENGARESFSRILDSGRLLLAVLNDVLDLSKIEALKLECEIVPVRPEQVFKDLLSIWRAAAEAKSLALTCVLDERLPAAFLSDPVRLVQILSNLVSNAIKFTARGAIEVTATVDGADLAFCVADSGIGIRTADLERLFEAFEQADGMTTRVHGGTGLGLAISRRLAGLLGGTLNVTSEPGVGSRFLLRIPLVVAPAPPEAVIARLGLGEQPLAGVRVLAAEDNVLSAVVLEDALLSFGAEVTLAENGVKAVELVATTGGERFDIVLMDLQMPELDGLQATRQIRALDPTLPVVGQTAHAQTEERERCHDAGMVDVLTKPIDFVQLVDIIARNTRRRPA